MRIWLWVGLVLTLCGSARADIRVVDDRDREVVLSHPAQRVVALAPHIVESVFAVGAGDKLVGAVSYSDYPEAAKAVPRVGSYDKVNYESLVALQPDLVLAWASGNGPEIVERIEELGFSVYVAEPRAIESIARSLRHYGKLTGHDRQGQTVAAEFEQSLSELRQRYGGKEPVTVFYQVWNDPLLTLNDEHLISDVIRLCGGRNVFADSTPMVLNIGVESVLRRDPQAIVASGMGEARPEWLDNWRHWPGLSAVRNDNLYFVPPSLVQRHSTRIVEGARRMCESLDRTRQKAVNSKENADKK